MLEELGAPYRHAPHMPQSAEVRAINPSGKVPVLVADGVPLTDSTAIIQFLADRHGRFTAPPGTIERARQDGFTQFLLDEFDALLWTAARHSFILPEHLRQSAIKDTLRWEFRNAQAELVRRMGQGPYLMGAAFSVPDIILTHCCNWATVARFPIEEDAIRDYLERTRARDAYRRLMG
ncbi:MAG: glutathione S-transferase family protein [Alphaproteobacteria bacterium]|nr:MAG: glutathione S-transferase family protein [Alphaproteobacteria bacterium]